MSGRKRISDVLAYILIGICCVISVLILIGIIAYVFIKGIGVVDWSFLSSVTSVLNGTVGIAGNIVNTIIAVVLTLLISAPVGICGAIYLNEYAKPGKIVSAIEFATETLSGIPSIIFGMFGMVFFVEGLHMGYSLLAGSLTLSLMVLPLITRNTQEALKTVPDSYRQGAIGLGSSKLYMIVKILIPSAMQGIVTGVILAVGRVVGESAVLLFTAGSAKLLPNNVKQLLLKPFQSGGTLTVQMYLSATSEGDFDTAFGIAVVLLVIVLCINFLTKLLTRLFNKSTRTV
ncbi:phosphate ABC transporter permease PstA [uncultured Eubacterium sp.]|uniref:phosphate ABC transporter permease PstA n=1 Tax=uncultured Eubacterium sp. TaxID=165185 RepID=UPI0015B7C2EE|nr:phosphate ABC transporter permease PstA [uncultured Eubacterium sp.]